MKFAGFCQFRYKMNDPNEEVKENMKIFLYELFGFAILLWKKNQTEHTVFEIPKCDVKNNTMNGWEE